MSAQLGIVLVANERSNPQGENRLARKQDSSNKPQTRRRTQQERSASTKRALLDATIKCVGSKGYAATSISQILNEVEVSRGALLHHFPSKIELVAAAINDFYATLSAEVNKQLEKIDPENDTFRQRLDIVNEVYNRNPAARLEFMVAARTDPELAKTIQKEGHDSSSDFYPQLNELEAGESLKMLISSFLLGNSLMAAWESWDTDSPFDIFVEMVEHHIQEQRRKESEA